MAKLARFCNDQHRRNYRHTSRTALHFGTDTESAMAVAGFCCWCGAYVPNRNERAANVAGLLVNFTPNPDHFPEAVIRCQLLSVGLDDFGRIAGVLRMPSGAILVEELDRRRVSDVGGLCVTALAGSIG